MWSVRVVVKRRLQVQQDVSSYVEADQIGQRQRPHRVLVAKNHRRVDVLGARNAVGQHADGFVSEDNTEATGRKPRDVVHQNRGFAHGASSGLCCFDGGLSGLIVANQFQQLHDRYWIEKMHADDTLWSCGC